MRGKQAGRAESEGDSYLASLSDLMVGMLFIFIIMLMAFALNYRQAQEESEKRRDAAVTEQRRTEEERRQATEENERLKRGVQDLERVRSVLTENEAIRRRLLEEVRRTLRRRGVEAIVDPEAGIVRLGDRLLFDSGQSVLREEGRRNIGELASVLAQILPCYAAGVAANGACANGARPILEAIYVEGHTDNVPFGGRIDGNWVLSTQRAVTTFRELVDREPSLRALRNLDARPLLGVSGYGETRPVAENDHEAGRTQNRRIDLRFVLATIDPERLRAATDDIRRRYGLSP